ncbi:MAG: calcium/sodium antiporter [Elusimicrobia bacterium]|nr:calcium/sodium antiporter [Elusimicrobiota bacterium]
MFNILYLLLGFMIIIKGADFLVDGASAFARRFRVSDLVIGLTIVAFGTSTPELFVNIFASAKGNTEIAIGNIVGSNIFNLFLILGISSLIYPLAVTKGTVWKEIPFSLLAAILLGVLANDALLDQTGRSVLSRMDGFVFLAFFAVFLCYIAVIAKDNIKSRHADVKNTSLAKSIFMIIGGLSGLVLGGKLVESGAVDMAANLGVSQSLIGLTIVAAGTSLPELATSAVAAFKKNCDIAVGNIVGSNIFNIFFVLGISSLIKPLPITPHFNMDIFVLIGASILLFFFMFTGKRRMLDRWEGAIFIILYIVYAVFLVKGG